MFRIKTTVEIAKGVIAGAALLTAGLFPSAVMAAPIYAVDTLIGSASIASGVHFELAALQQFAEDFGETGTLVLDEKIDTPNPALVAFDDGGNWYIDVGPAMPGYFMLKFGNGSTDHPSHYFFKNTGEMTKLVWTNAQVNFLTGGDCLPPEEPKKNGKPKPKDTSSCNIGRLSHYLITDGAVPPTETPEPTSIALAGLGMLGLWASRRKAKNN